MKKGVGKHTCFYHSLLSLFSFGSGLHHPREKWSHVYQHSAEGIKLVKWPKTCHEGQILTFSITFPSTSLHEVDVILLGCDRANAPIFTFLTLFTARI